MTFLPVTFLVDILAALLFLVSIRAIHEYQRRGGLSYPPGPRPLPLIGNLLNIPKDSSWLAYTQFSKTYGTSLFFSDAPSDRNYRRYRVFPRLWAGYCHLELDQSSQRLAREEWRHLL
jgi:hypothetical protein